MLGLRGAHLIDTAARRFATQAAKPSALQQLLFDVPTQNALTEEFPGVPAVSGKVETSGVQVSKLQNGVTVVSQDQGGAAAAVGLFVKAGSRFETVPGTAHVLEHLAYNSTQNRSTLKVARDAENAGAVIAAKASRESFAYTGEVLRGGADAVASIITEAATAPKLWYWEVNEGKEAVAPLVEAVQASPVTALIEGVHAAAFGTDSALGHSLYATPESLGDVTADTLRGFLGATFVPENMVLSGVNLSQRELTDLAERYLAALPAAGAIPKSPKPVYIGGESMIRGASTGTAHVAVALPAPTLASGKSLYALGVLQALLGSSSAAKGPARQSRLARSAHNDAHSFIRSISAFAFPYTDAGLLGIAGSCADHEAGRLVNAMVGFLKDTASVAATTAELDRAKKAYKLAVAADVESRGGALSDMGLSVLLTGKAGSLRDTLAAIDAVTAADVQAVAKAALAAPPTISAIGSLQTVPRYDQVAQLLK